MGVRGETRKQEQKWGGGQAQVGGRGGVNLASEILYKDFFNFGQGLGQGGVG